MKYKRLFFASNVVIIVGILLAFFAVQKLGGWTYTAHRLHTIKAWPTYTQRLSQLELLPIDSADVVLLGDSHVAFGAWEEWLPAKRVANRGIPGEGIERMSAFAKTQDLSNAHLLVVQVGTNDLLFHDTEEVIELFKGMVEALSELNVPVVYCTLPGVNNQVRWTGIDSRDIDILNSYILTINGSGQHVLDLAGALNTESGVLPKGLTDDGVHLRGEGYRVWSTEIHHYLNRVVAHQ